VLPPEVIAVQAPPRLAAVRTPVWDLADAVAQQAFFDQIVLLRARGADVHEIELDPAFAHAHAAHRTIMFAEAARELASLQGQHRAQLSDKLNELIDSGRAISDSAYAEARVVQGELQGLLGAFLRNFDAIVTPPTRGEAPDNTVAHTGDPTFCTIWSLCGVPAITVPAGHGPHGLPLGLQVVGPTRGDVELLGIAAWCEAQFGRAGLAL
jgi:Asp-tRNA(Asn)/Glu-tRNA(Gln) amidotransferase A subunit family amidase